MARRAAGAGLTVLAGNDALDRRHTASSWPTPCGGSTAAASVTDERLSALAGRVTVDEWPTGVALTWAQQHGDPWPATTTRPRRRSARPR